MAENNKKKRPIVKKLDKEMEDISKSLNTLGKGFSKLLGIGTTASSVADELGEKSKGVLTKNKKLLLANQKIVNDRFKTLTKELGLTKNLNIYASAAADISDQLKENAKKTVDKKKKLSDEEIKILKRQRRQLRIMSKIHEINEAFTEALGEQSTHIKNLGKSIKLFLFNPLTAIVALFGASVARVFEVDKALTEGARSAGALRGQMQNVSNELEAQKGFLESQGVNLDQAMKIGGAIAKNQGLITTDIAEATVAVAKFSAMLGTSEEDSAKLFTTMNRTLGVTAKAAPEMLKFAKNMSEASGVPLGLALEDIKGMSEETAAVFAGQPKKLLEATIQARGLGLTIDQINKGLSGVTDVQSTFNEQARLSALLGRRVNLLKVNQLKMEGKGAEAVKEFNKQVFKSTTAAGQLAEFNEMGVIRQQEIIKASKQTSEEYRNQLLMATKTSKADIAAAKAAADQLALQQRIAATGKRFLDQITRIFGPYIEKMMLSALRFMENVDITPYMNSVIDFFKSDTFKGIGSGIASAFKIAMEYGKKIVGFFKENPKLAIGLTLGAAALIKGIMMLKGGALGGIMKFAPMAMKALPALAGLAGVIAGGFMAVKNIGTIFSEDKKIKDVERTKSMSSMAGMAVGGMVGGLFGPIGAVVGASIGGALGQMDFGQKLIGNIISQNTIDGIKDIVTNIRDTADAAIAAFKGAEGESIGSRIGLAIGAAIKNFDFIGAFTGMVSITEDLLIIVGDIIGGVFGQTGFGLYLSNAIRSGIDLVISYLATVQDRFKRMGAKLDLAITEALSFDVFGKRVGATDAEIKAKQDRVRDLDKKIQTYMDTRVLGKKEGADGGDFSTSEMKTESMKKELQKQNELLEKLVIQQGGGNQIPIQLNIDGKKVGTAIANSSRRE